MIIAVILIGGSGKRFGSSLPKQFMRVNGKDMFVFATEEFKKNKLVDNILIVYPKGWRNYVTQQCEAFHLSKVIHLVEGGDTRQASGKTKYGANLGFLQASRFLKREMEDYDDIVYLPFENMKLPCPVGYKRCLDYIYGKDWHVVKKGLACHNIWKYDTDTPWEAYCDYYKRCQTDNKAKIAIETSQNCSTKT